jgi:hypothetical protein
MPEDDLEEQCRRVLEALAPYPDAKNVRIPLSVDSVRAPEEPYQPWVVIVDWGPLQLSPPRVSTREDINTFFNGIVPEYRYRGDRFLRPVIEEGGKKPPSCLMAWWLLLYSWSILARYQPRKWTDLLDLNKSRGAVALQYALEVAISVVPNLVLDALDREPWLTAKPIAF